jgi:hypothetical protein
MNPTAGLADAVEDQVVSVPKGQSAHARLIETKKSDSASWKGTIGQARIAECRAWVALAALGKRWDDTEPDGSPSIVVHEHSFGAAELSLTLARDEDGHLIPEAPYAGRSHLVVSGALVALVEAEALGRALRSIEQENAASLSEGSATLDLETVLRHSAKSADQRALPSNKQVEHMLRHTPEHTSRGLRQDAWDVAAPVMRPPTEEDCARSGAARVLDYFLRLSKGSGAGDNEIAVEVKADRRCYGERTNDGRSAPPASGQLFIEQAKYRQDVKGAIKERLKEPHGGIERIVTAAMVAQQLRARMPERWETEPAGLSRTQAGLYGWHFGGGVTIYTETDWLRERCMGEHLHEVGGGDSGASRGRLFPIADVLGRASAEAPPRLTEEYWERSADERLLLDEGHDPEVIDSMGAERIRDEAQEVRHRAMGEPTDEEWAEINADTEAA